MPGDRHLRRRPVKGTDPVGSILPSCWVLPRYAPWRNDTEATNIVGDVAASAVGCALMVARRLFDRGGDCAAPLANPAIVPPQIVRAECATEDQLGCQPRGALHTRGDEQLRWPVSPATTSLCTSGPNPLRPTRWRGDVQLGRGTGPFAQQLVEVIDRSPQPGFERDFRFPVQLGTRSCDVRLALPRIVRRQRQLYELRARPGQR